MIKLLLVSMTIMTAAFELPKGYDEFHWGTTVEELTSRIDVNKADLGSEYSYADHTETDPEVYVRLTSDKTRIEYYFFEGVLYKIYVVYDRAKSSPEFYQEKILETQKKYGPAQSHFQENIFGIMVLHVKWDDSKSTLDLRNGAGYIYEVYVNKEAERKKASQIRKRAIQEKSV